MDWTPEEIKAFRKSLTLYQKDFAKLLGVKREQVVYLERGVRKPTETLKKLLTCLEEKKKGKGGKHGKAQRAL